MARTILALPACTATVEMVVIDGWSVSETPDMAAAASVALVRVSIFR